MTKYWFNVQTKQVESDDDRSGEKNVLGPYPTYEAASQALQTAAERTEEWDEEDRKWNEGAVEPEV